MFSIGESKREALSKLRGHRGTPALLTLTIGAINLALSMPAILLYWQEILNIIRANANSAPWTESFPFDSDTSAWRLQALASTLALVVFVINAALSIAVARFYLALAGDPDTATFGTFFEGLTHWSKSILAMLWRNLWLWLWELLVVTIFMCAGGILLLIFSLFAGGFQNFASPDEHFGTGGTLALAAIALLLYSAMIAVICNRAYAYSQMMLIQAEYPSVSVSKTLKASIAMTKGCRGKLFLLDMSFAGWGLLVLLTLGIGALWLYPYMSATHVAVYRRLKAQAFESGLFVTSRQEAIVLPQEKQP